MSHSCPGGSLPVHLVDGSAACQTIPEIDCRPPTVMMCSPALLGPICRCEVPRPLICEARIEFPAGNPSAATLSPPLPGCELAVAAIAAALAKALQPLP